MPEPRLLLCDEPLLSLDPVSQQEVVALINTHRQQAGTTVVFVTHEINPVVPVTDRVLYVASGRWAAGTTDQVMTSQSLSALYGTSIDVVRVHGRIVVVGGEEQSAVGSRPAGRHPGGTEDHHHQVPEQGYR